MSLLKVWLAVAGVGLASTAGQTPAPYTLRVAADEVNLSFHAADFSGKPIDDLTLADLRLLDNGKRPREIVAFSHSTDTPARAGILFDISGSMLENVALNRRIASYYVTHLMRSEIDRAFVMRFDSDVKVKQEWTNDGSALASSLRGVADDAGSRLGGTALFDSLYKACRDQWQEKDSAVSGNFLILFTDGVDNASHARLSDVVEMCQQRHVSIYAFSNESKSIFAGGHKTVKELAEQSGGKVFFDQTEAGIVNDLRIMEAGERSQYRIVYKPARLKPDGSFHRIKLDSPARGGVLVARSGYYAPGR